MPILKSAKKALRQNKKRRLLNLRRLRAMRQAIKNVKKAVDSDPKDLPAPACADRQAGEIQKLISLAYKAIDKAAKRGVIKKNTASRKKSRLTLHLLTKVQGKQKTESATPSQPPTSPEQLPSQSDQS